MKHPNVTSLIGTWTNSYGSSLNVTDQNKEGLFTGIYSSDTGSTGKYQVIGYTPTAYTANQPIALGVYWRSLVEGKPDPSWNWVSVMNGLLITAAPGQVTGLQLLHGMVASCPFPVVDIYGPGVYTQTLDFKPATKTERDEQLPLPNKIDNNNILSGSWVNINPSAIYQNLSIVTYDQSPVLSGTLTLPYTKVKLFGFYNYKPSNSPLISVSLSGLYTNDQGRPQTITLGGNFNPKTGQIDTVCFVANGVSSKELYSCVDSQGSVVFTKAKMI